VKREPSWSHGILLVMLGIVLGVMGIMQAVMLPVRGMPNWSLACVGLACAIGGVIVAKRSKIDRSLPANEKRLPSARVRRSPRR